MHRKVKITYMIDTLDTDMAGTENQLLKMINGLDKKRFLVNLISLNHSPWLQKNALSLGCSVQVIEVNRIKKIYTYINLLRIIRSLRGSAPDIVHTFFPVSNVTGVIAAKVAGVKSVVSSRRDYGDWMNKRYLLATRFADKFVTRILANSNRVKELTEEKEKVKGSKIDVILNGINADLFENVRTDHALKKRLNIPDGDRVVGIVANFRPMKHYDTFLKAAAEILKARDDVSFLLVGTGPLKTQMEELAKRLGIYGKTRFAGPQKDVRPYLSIMDVGVNCSEAEGLSNAIMEYMATGLPCVVSNAGGNTDLITNDYNGYTFELDDQAALVSLVLKLLDDPGTRERFAKNSREMVRKNLSLGVIISRYEDFYLSLASA